MAASCRRDFCGACFTFDCDISDRAVYQRKCNRLLTLQVDEHRAEVNEWLLKTSELVKTRKKSAGKVSGFNWSLAYGRVQARYCLKKNPNQ
ncbi:hypothetical protein A4A36_11215 [Bacillus subtilis]|nr:hypothetical protein A4A35_02720 [Bacillus subtilis]OIS66445.1 hypothetical protein A4A37_17645 [Bacillus subtilis]OIS71018.1 hypothetical protein A4A36_11215 [Bacillus subtilis]